MTNIALASTPFSIEDLLALYAEQNPADWVDADMRGNPISSAQVLLIGAYGPAVRRLLARVAQEPTAPTWERLLELAEEAFNAQVDRDFQGGIITNYSVVLAKPHGFGETLAKLANLVQMQPAGMRGPE